MWKEPWLEGRPTIYNGIRMRSRLEARWAAQFDEHKDLGWIFDWQYEPRCFANKTGEYLPDFRIERNDGQPVYIEIKPFSYLHYLDPEPWMEKMEMILSSEWWASLRLYMGTPPEPLETWIYEDEIGWFEV